MSDVLGDVALQDQTLEDVASAVNYRRWLVSLALPYLGEHAVEIGAGQGDYVEDWAAAGIRITASEAEPGRLELLRERFTGNELVDVVAYTAPSEVEGSYSAAVAYNVLEHIPDDVAALRGFAKLLRPGAGRRETGAESQEGAQGSPGSDAGGGSPEKVAAGKRHESNPSF